MPHRVYSEWEYRELEASLESTRRSMAHAMDETMRLKAACLYLADRMRKQALVVNEHLGIVGATICSSMLDDVDDTLIQMAHTELANGAV